jgi:hypothetical protein
MNDMQECIQSVLLREAIEVHQDETTRAKVFDEWNVGGLRTDP